MTWSTDLLLIFCTFNTGRSPATIAVIILIMRNNVISDLEIVGLSSSTSGRSCILHEMCGETLNEGDVCRLILITVVINQREEEAIKVVKVVDGTDTCTIGFVSRSFTAMERVYSHAGRLVEINEIYKNLGNEYKQQLAARNKGMASASLLDEQVMHERVLYPNHQP